MRWVSWVLFGVLLSSYALAAGKPQKAEAAWVPEKFELNSDRLPANYVGLDRKKVAEVVVAKERTHVKGEFETTEEYKKRLTVVLKDFAPLSVTDSYAFKVPEFSVSYDPDIQAYKVGGGRWCRRGSNDDRNYVSCTIGSIDRNESTYTGANAFGRTATIHRVIEKNFALAFPVNSAAVKRLLTWERLSHTNYRFEDRLPVSMEKAKSLKGMEVAALLVGNFLEARFINSDNDRVSDSPTINKPYDITVYSKSVPFYPQRLIYYVVETGEILKQIQLEGGAAASDSKLDIKISNVRGIRVAEVGDLAYAISDIPNRAEELQFSTTVPQKFASNMKNMTFGEKIDVAEATTILEAYYAKIADDPDSMRLQNIEVLEQTYATWCSEPGMFGCSNYQMRAGTLIKFDLSDRGDFDRNGSKAVTLLVRKVRSKQQ